PTPTPVVVEPTETPVVTPPPTPPSTGPTLVLLPEQGAPGTEIVAFGLGWEPDDTLFVGLTLSAEDEAPTSLAYGGVEEDGRFTISFTFPTDPRWADQTYVLVRAWSTTTKDEAYAVFRVLPEGQTPVPEPTETPTPVGCTDRVSFVRDVTMPDNTRVLPGQSFVKTWRLRNSGTCTWTDDYALVFVEGHRMGGPTGVPLDGPVAPGETVDVSVSLTAPAGDGVYQGKWQLRNDEGQRFGLGNDGTGNFWVRIVVGATPTPTPRPSGWRGEYFDDRNLTGAPTLVRDDAAVNFDWGTAAPASSLPSEGFSVRWSQTLSFPAGVYRFAVLADDGVRVWLDGERIIDQWHDATGVTYTAERTLSAGNHSLRVEYYENRGAAKIRFWWERLSDYPQWRGEYFSRIDLVGVPTLVRNDPAIDFIWGASAPATNIPADNFSVRWTRLVAFDEGLYRFHAAIDDGVRLWVDDQLVIDRWSDGARRALTADHRLSAGYHSLRVEYYERTGEASIQVWWEKLVAYPDWQAEYWSNRYLSGSPVLVRNDATINFNWGGGSPARGIPADSFSARWTRMASFERGTYRFHVLVDDGARLWVDDQLLIDTWRDGAAREITVDHALTEGRHSLRVTYYEHTGEARIRVWWEKLESPSFPNWRGEYWPRRDLSGTPALVRNDASIDFDWGGGAPAVGLPADNVSVRWTRQLNFERGVYRLHARADDGIRVFVDGNRVINEWHDSDASQVYTVDLVLDGRHRVVVEYYEYTGQALAKFWWRRVGDVVTPTPVPPTPTPPAPVNRPPVALDDAAVTDEDTPVTLNVLRNDSDLDGDTLSVINYSTSSARGGTVSCTTAGACTYTPPANFNGIDTFVYTASDGRGGTDTATVVVNVRPVNDAPVAVNDAATTERNTAVEVNVLSNDSDPDGDDLVVAAYDAASAEGGTVSCTTAGVCTYTPATNFVGSDSFVYTASDGKGGSDTATVTVDVTGGPAEPARPRLNEILAVPGAVDWNQDGAVDEQDEWVELVNLGQEPLDLGGWVLDDAIDAGSEPYTIPADTVLPAGGFLVLYGSQTGIGLADEGGVLLLLDPEGKVVDRVPFDMLPADTSFARAADGTWHAGWPPSPGGPNSPSEAMTLSLRGTSFLQVERPRGVVEGVDAR
ncbi:MAG: PA14 domain-containing protein, partial [Anaerolineae bacterium]